MIRKKGAVRAAVPFLGNEIIMDILFYNTKAYIEDGCFAEAVLVHGNRIAEVGSNDELLAKAGPSCEVTDCGGRVLVPGFNDSHMHLMEFGGGLRQAPVGEARSAEELIQICRRFAKEQLQMVRNGLHAAGWNQDFFPDHRIPDRHDLDRISTEFPVVLERVCGHICCTNSKAIEMLGLTADSPQPEDGRFGTFAEKGLAGTYAAGEPNGIFYGGACLGVRNLIPEFTEEERLGILEDAMKYAASRGVTCVQSNDVGAMSGEASDNFALFRRLYEEGRGCIRFRHQVNFESPEDFRECIENGEYAYAKKLYPEGSLLTLGPLKLYKDGSIGARTALMKHGYRGTPGVRGLEWYSDEEMMEYIRLAAEHGIQVVTHCIGDAATNRTADCYVRCNREVLDTEGNPLRHALVHCQLTDSDTLAEIARHELLAMVQPVFLQTDLAVLDDLIDPELSATSYAFCTILSGGSCTGSAGRIPLSLGTDCPVEDLDPFRNIYCAVTRRQLPRASAEDALGDETCDTFTPSECLTVSQAVDAYTAGSAYAMFMEGELGRIAPGYLADLVLLDMDIFDCSPEDLLHTNPIMTMVDGQIAFRKE